MKFSKRREEKQSIGKYSGINRIEMKMKVIEANNKYEYVIMNKPEAT